MYGMRVLGTHGSRRNTYPNRIGTSGSSIIGALAIRRRTTSTNPARTASVLAYQRTGLPIAVMTCNCPSGVANKGDRRIVRSMSGQLHQGEPQELGMAAVIFSAASMCHAHVSCHASQGFPVTLTSCPT